MAAMVPNTDGDTRSWLLNRIRLPQVMTMLRLTVERRHHERVRLILACVQDLTIGET